MANMGGMTSFRRSGYPEARLGICSRHGAVRSGSVSKETIKTLDCVRQIVAGLSLVVIVSVCLGCTGPPYRNGTVPRLFGYDAEAVAAYLKKTRPKGAVFDGQRVFGSVSRDSSGRRLFIFPSVDVIGIGLPLDPALVIGADGQVLSEPRCPGFPGSFDDNLECTVWCDGAYSAGGLPCHFVDGRTMATGRWATDPAGNYFWYEAGQQSIVVSTRSSSTQILTSDLEVGLPKGAIFARGNNLYLFGRARRQDGTGAGMAQIFRRQGSSWVEDRRIKFGDHRASVIDLDPLSENILIIDQRDPFLFWDSTWRLFDLQTRKSRDLGAALDVGFFLMTNSAPF